MPRHNPEGWTSPYPSGHHEAKVQAVVDLLTDWFNALEDGSHQWRLPSPSYQRRHGRPTWTDEELERFIDAVDKDIERELHWASANPAMGCQAGPSFHRLALAQRLAFAQQMDELLARYEIPPAETDKPVSGAAA